MNMKNLNKLITALIMIPVIVYAFGANAQQSDLISWEKTYGGSTFDGALSIKQTSDGGYITCGYAYSNDGDVNDHYGAPWYPDGWVVKLNAAGDTLWTKSLGGTYDEYANDVIQTNDGGYIVALQTNSTDSFSQGGWDYWIVKLDSMGTVEWQKNYGGTGTDKAFSVVQTNDGNYMVAGYSSSTDGDVTGNIGGSTDFWIIKIDTIGNMIWDKSYGGTSSDIAYSIEPTNDYGYIIGGYSYSNDVDVDTNKGGRDYWILKIDSAGNIDWQKALGGAWWDICSKVIQTSDGGYIAAGFSASDDGDATVWLGGSYDYWIVKLDSIGTIEWEKTLGGSDIDIANSIIQSSDGGYMVAVYSASNDSNVTFNHGKEDYWIVKLDTAGNIQWEESLGGDSIDYAYSIIQLNDGSYVVAGFSQSMEGDVTGVKGKEDFWIVKLKCNPPVIPEICVVTVDSATQKNLVVWEKPAVNNIAYFNIYKEGIVAFQYNLIGTVPFDSLSIFLDNASNPKVQAYRYKISIVDTCGYESLLSDSNKTIHLAITLGIPPAINLIIDGYEGFNFPTYYIWGGNAGGMNIIDTINSTLPQYTVLNPGPTDSLFFLELLHPTGCTATPLAKVLIYNSARSNVSNRTIPTGISNPSLQVGMGFNIYPNPYTGKTEIYYNLTQKANVTLEVLNVLGKKVKTIVNKVQHAGKYQYKFAGSETENSSGIFILKLIVNDKVYTKRLVNL
ncbi:MAG: T9SS type A sorting domain-containing protein [Cytophagales bacterium]|nr:T9SS type A sorting domain-containing protein [Cytophagales bacterium]